MPNVDELNALLGAVGAGIPPADAIAETFPRRHAISTAYQPATGVLQMFGIYLPGGKTITNINFVSGGTAESGGTNLWVALYDQYLNLLAQSTNDTGATTFSANTNLRKALATAQTTKYAGLHYIGYMQTNGAGAQASLLCLAAPASSVANGIVPIISATSSTGLTTTAPNPAAALVVQVNTAYAYVS
jgi:hypothetical protein